MIGVIFQLDFVWYVLMISRVNVADGVVGWSMRTYAEPCPGTVPPITCRILSRS